MAELGLLLVGPIANRLELTVESSIPTLQVRAEDITPLDDDLPTMVGYAASGTFHGPDADRFELLDESSMRVETEMLWACAQVQSAGIAQAAAQWDRVLVIAWLDEPALIPAVRALAVLRRPITVLLGGERSPETAPAARRNNVVLADMLRHDRVQSVIHNADPSVVLDVAIDAARSPQRTAVTRAKPVDLGPVLDLPPTWTLPAAAVSFYELVYVPMGHASGLPQLAVDLAAWRALGDLVNGPPVDVTSDLSIPSGRSQLPEGDVHKTVSQAVATALDGVEFAGTEPLVEQISRVLRPVLRRVQGLVDAVVDVERQRLSHMRSFTAVGIRYTCQNLAARLDGIRDPYPIEVVEELETLIAGQSESESGVHLTEWRRAFAGVPSCIVHASQPGSATARDLVKERFGMFKAEYASAIGDRIDVLVTRARDVEAQPSTLELRDLKVRADRVQQALKDVIAKLDVRIEAACEDAVRDDRFVRWTAPDGKRLRQLFLSRGQALPVGPLLDRLTTEALSRRPLGMSDNEDFEVYLAELTRTVHQIAPKVAANPEQLPSYESVLLLLLQGRDPPVLRQALAHSAGTEVELHLERPVAPALMNWLTATGMLVVVAPRLKTCAIYWQKATPLAPPASERQRLACTEHRLADLVLPPPDGDTAGSLVALVRSTVFVILGLVTGELGVRRREGQAAYPVYSQNIEIPERTLLPHGALQLFATDERKLDQLERRVERRILRLPMRQDAEETLKKLMELAQMGPAPTLAAQLGLYGARFEHLEHPILALLQIHAGLALATLVDVLDGEALERIALPTGRRALVDVHQLGPSGA